MNFFKNEGFIFACHRAASYETLKLPINKNTHILQNTYYYTVFAVLRMILV